MIRRTLRVLRSAALALAFAAMATGCFGAADDESIQGGGSPFGNAPDASSQDAAASSDAADDASASSGGEDADDGS